MRCEHGIHLILHCSRCPSPTRPCGCGENTVCDRCQRATSGPRDTSQGAEIALSDAHRRLFAAIEYLEDARRQTTEEHASAIADLAEEIRVQQESLEAVFGALVLRRGRDA